MDISFAKAHGAKNDFLLSWQDEAPQGAESEAAIAICDRNTGIGADGWLLCTRPGQGTPEYDIRIRLFNADGGEVEMSGNGTRCAAAWAMVNGHDSGSIRILTGAGQKHLQLLERRGTEFLFEMNMGKPAVHPGEVRFALEIGNELVDCTILNVGNPQCVVFVENFDLDWPAIGAEIERHPHFPKKTNVSFVRPVDGLNIDVRFFERGVGVTNSSGTGSTGAAVASILRGFVGRELTVQTVAGPLDFRWPSAEEDVVMVGPAELIGKGTFFFKGSE